MTELRLSNLNLEEFPPAVTSLRMLNSLDLSHNSIEQLAPRLGQLSNLGRLDLASNSCFSSLEGIGVLARLEWLDVSGCVVEEFNEELTSLSWLQHLDLTDNQLSALPDNFGQLRFRSLISFWIVSIMLAYMRCCWVAVNSSPIQKSLGFKLGLGLVLGLGGLRIMFRVRAYG